MEHYYAYKIQPDKENLICSHSVFEEDKMIELLNDINATHFKGIYWIFKKTDDHEKEPLCLIDAIKRRVYYFYSGEVVDFDVLINKLKRKPQE